MTWNEMFVQWMNTETAKKNMDVYRIEMANKPHEELARRYSQAFLAGWNAKTGVEERKEASPYESSTIAIGTDAGYQAFHEAVQEGWEPLIHWRDDKGDHFMMRRLRR